MFSIEPGVYARGFGGCRIEDNCAALADHGEYLADVDVPLD